MMKLWMRYVELTLRRPGLVLAFGVLLCGVAVLGARFTKVQTRIEALLPADSPALQDMEELRERVPGSSPLRIAIASSNGPINRALAEEITAALAEWPETRVVYDRRDPTYLLDRRLLLLPEADLEQLANTLEDRFEFERCERMPGCVNFDDRPELPDADALQAQWRELPEARAMEQLFGEGFLDRAGRRERETIRGEAREGREVPLGSLCAPDLGVCAVQAVLDGDPRRIAYAQSILDRCEELFTRLRARVAAGELGENPPDDLQLEVDGDFRNAPMTKRSVEDDLARTTWVGVLLLAFVLLVQFRALRALPFLLLPCAAGILWTLGILGALGITLNMISAFVLAILMGLGVDFGVHLLTFYGRLRGEGATVEDALRRTAAELAPAMLAAALTTIAGFLALLAARFRGLSQLGPIAALGIALSLLAFALLFPSLVVLFNRVRPVDGILRGLPWLRPLALGRRAAQAIVSVGLLIALGLGALALGAFGEGVTLETTTDSLQPTNVRHGIAVREAFGGTTKTNVVLLADSQEALQAALADLRTRNDEGVPLDSALFLAPDTFFPTGLDARMAAIERIADVTGRMIRSSENPSAGLQRVHELASGTTPLVLEDMPQWLRELLVERDGSFGRLAVVFLRMRGSDSEQMAKLTDAMNTWRREHPQVSFGSSHALLGEVLPTLRQDGPRMLGLAVLGVLLALGILARPWRRGVVVLAALAVAFACTGGLMVLVGIRVNMFNLLVVPVGFGIAIDGAIYVAWHLREGGSAARNTFRAVLFSTLTTLTAFGALVAAHHPGLQSVGWLALLAMSTATVINLVWLPALMTVLGGNAPEEAKPGEG
ncbi:MAG: MMPL family transporter [Sandaracinus sp.]|nr:MMPL family transporter [Sandaracinus sp.]